jgi:hypothetical protein
MLWRAWHLRNDIMHGDGAGSVTGSVHFLLNYMESLKIATEAPSMGTSDKGKGKLGEECRLGTKNRGNKLEDREVTKWQAPPQGWVKLNTDAGFRANTGEASAGVVIRGANRQVILSSWRLLRKCSTVEEAEAKACLERSKAGGSMDTITHHY